MASRNGVRVHGRVARQLLCRFKTLTQYVPNADLCAFESYPQSHSNAGAMPTSHGQHIPSNMDNVSQPTRLTDAPSSGRSSLNTHAVAIVNNPSARKVR